MKHFKIKIALGLILAFWALQAEAALVDVKSAVMYGNYQQAQDLAEDIMNTSQAGYVYDEAYYFLGVSHLKKKEYFQAQTAFDDLINRNPLGSIRDRAYLGLFDAYYLTEDYQQSFTVAEEFLQYYSNSQFLSSMYFRMARANFKLGFWDEGYQYLQKIVNYFPNSFDYPTAQQFLNEKPYYAVQVGAYKDRSRAQQQVDDLKRKGEDAYLVETVDQNNARFYRVRVGQLTHLPDADQLREHLAQEGFLTQIYP